MYAISRRNDNYFSITSVIVFGTGADMEQESQVIVISKQNIKQRDIKQNIKWSHTVEAKTKEIAKSGPSKPSCNPMADARAVTVAEWDDGIPPDPTNWLRSHLLSLNLHT